MKINDIMILNPDRIGEIIQAAVLIGYNKGMEYTIKVIQEHLTDFEQKEFSKNLQKEMLDTAIGMACETMYPEIVVSVMDVIKKLEEDFYGLETAYIYNSVDGVKCVGNTVYIFTARPGILIGKGGEFIDKLKEELNKVSKNGNIEIEIIETKDNLKGLLKDW